MMSEQPSFPSLDLPRAQPFLKWAGGKRAIVPEIVRHLPTEFRDYYEPFCGGGAVFFALDSRIQAAHLSDSNPELMLTYRMLQKDTGAVIAELERHAQHHARAYYLKIREEGHAYQDPVRIAARFIYLNRTCYNGLYRVNSQDRFNVPIGRYTNPTICDADNLLAVAEVLKKARLRVQSFEQIQPTINDLVYCDPPYDATFSGYTGQGFTESDQRALRDACQRWQDAGAHILLSNSDTDLIRKLYQGFRIVPIEAPRRINCRGGKREKVVELLICGA